MPRIRFRQGVALASVLFLMLVMFGCGMSYFACVKMSCAQATHSLRQARASAVARSGLEWFYCRAQLVAASAPGYTLPGPGVSTSLNLAPGEVCNVTQLSGPPANACLAEGFILDTDGRVLARRRLALPNTTGTAMTLMYDPDRL